MSETTEVRPGQVWADNDKRCKGRRTLQVLDVVGQQVRCQVVTDWQGEPDGHRITRIALRRFRPTSTGYRLVKDAEAQR